MGRVGNGIKLLLLSDVGTGVLLLLRVQVYQKGPVQDSDAEIHAYSVHCNDKYSLFTAMADRGSSLSMALSAR